MKWICGAFMAAAVTLAFAGTALAASGDGNASGGASGKASAEPIGTTVQTQSAANAKVSAESPNPERIEAKLDAIRERAKGMAAKEREALEKRLTASARSVDAEVVAKGEGAVVGRLASEFDVEATALIAERSQYDVGWGDLVVAYTLLANAGNEITMDQLFTLRSEGLGWGQISHGLGMRSDGLASAVRTEARVARGLVKPDGKAARVETSTRVSTSTGANATAGAVGVGAVTTTGVGVVGNVGK